MRFRSRSIEPKTRWNRLNRVPSGTGLKAVRLWPRVCRVCHGRKKYSFAERANAVGGAVHRACCRRSLHRPSLLRISGTDRRLSGRTCPPSPALEYRVARASRRQRRHRLCQTITANRAERAHFEPRPVFGSRIIFSRRHHAACRGRTFSADAARAWRERASGSRAIGAMVPCIIRHRRGTRRGGRKRWPGRKCRIRLAADHSRA